MSAQIDARSGAGVVPDVAIVAAVAAFSVGMLITGVAGFGGTVVSDFKPTGSRNCGAGSVTSCGVAGMAIRIVGDGACRTAIRWVGVAAAGFRCGAIGFVAASTTRVRAGCLTDETRSGAAVALAAGGISTGVAGMYTGTCLKTVARGGAPAEPLRAATVPSAIAAHTQAVHSAPLGHA